MPQMYITQAQHKDCLGQSRESWRQQPRNLSMLSQASPNESRPVEVATAPSYPSILLHPPLGTPSDIDAFNKAGRRVLVTLSPRGNSFAVYEATVCV